MAIGQVGFAQNESLPTLSEQPAQSPELAALLQSDAPAAIRDYYNARGNASIFLSGDAEAGRALIDALADQHRHALPAADDLLAELTAHATDAISGRGTAEGELAFARAWLNLAKQRLSGIVQPRALSSNMDRSLPELDEAELMARLDGDAVEAIAGLMPDHPHYAQLLDLRAELERVVAAGDWAAGEIPSGGSIEAGDTDARVPQIRARLRALGDYRDGGVPARETTLAGEEPLDGESTLDGEAPLDTVRAAPISQDGQRMDAVTVEALQAFQRRHGLNDDGVVGPKTLAALNTTAEERLRQVLVNLERVRWTGWDRDARHIYVNLPDYRATLNVDGEEVFETRVVVGQARHQTVEFSDTMTHMVVNPTWTVPRSIATEEILPALRSNPNYLNENNMSLIDDGSGVWVPPDTSMINWANFSQSYFPWWIRQGPGPGNALGNVKFMFPNEHAIYLHDTPSRSLFARDARAFSHGCVRVADYRGLAEALLSPQMSDPMSTFDRHRSTGRETRVNLDVKPAVHIDYRTVWVDEDGRAQFRDDMYGRDELVLDALIDLGVEVGAAQG
ncbi:murein L,D-transpeptidase [Roseobacter sp. HKCCA0434]|uniref:L,D-transpeptidase family protein n=1 Tax=Roseobacter sp. HKCCA0434 TaxID=3079297 RepID=UPI002905F05E|nr:L,D-transpeptidase family protein [Roseobacter sp. HKCCA0434]